MTATTVRTSTVALVHEGSLSVPVAGDPGLLDLLRFDLGERLVLGDVVAHGLVPGEDGALAHAHAPLREQYLDACHDGVLSYRGAPVAMASGVVNSPVTRRTAAAIDARLG